MRASRILGLTIALLGGVALAGKPERDKADELKNDIKKAETETKAACGCAVKVDVKWDSYKKVDDMGRIVNTLENFVTANKAYCQKPADKKSFCDGLKKFEISFSTNQGDIKYDGKTKALTTTSNDAGYTGDSQFTDIYNKW